MKLKIYNKWRLKKTESVDIPATTPAIYILPIINESTQKKKIHIKTSQKILDVPADIPTVSTPEPEKQEIRQKIIIRKKLPAEELDNKPTEELKEELNMETIPEKVEESNIELHTKIEDVSNEEIEKTEQLDNNQVTGTEDTTCESDAVKSALTLIDQEVDHIDKPEKSKHISLNPIMSGVVIVDSQPGIEKK